MTTLKPPPMTTPTEASPFDNNHADPWAKTFIDLPELNAKVTDAIANAITTVRSAARKKDRELRTSSLLVLGPAGAGKTHLFARLRHKLGPKAIFVHLRPLVGTEMTPRYVLGQIVQQLGYETTSRDDGGLKQLEALVGSSFALLDGESPDYPRIFLGDVAALDDAKRAQKLEAAVEHLLEQHQEADETYLTRLLEAPFMKPAHQRAALAWLAGRELEESQMKRLGVSTSIPEERIIQALQTLGLFAAPGAPIVLVFDQLENLMDAEATGSRIRAYANLVAELFDTTRGYVLVQMALDSEWEHAILPQLSAAQKTRLGGNTSVISLPTPAQSRELVRRWVEHLPSRPEPFPWPFGERRIDHWSSTPGMTPRMLMISCRQALALGPNAPFDDDAEEATPATERNATARDETAADAALAAAWEHHLESARRVLDEAADDRRSADPARLVGGIACAMRFLDGVSANRVDARQHVQVLARAGAEMRAMALLHQTHPRAVITALDRMSEHVSKGTAIALRERALEFPPTWKKVHAALVALLKRGVRWVNLERDDAARLLALESFLAAAKSRDLEDDTGRVFADEEVTSWIRRTLRIAEWPVSKALSGSERPATEADDAEVGDRVSTPSLPSNVDVDVAPRPGSADETAATIRACLAQLRVASLERLVREVVRVRPQATRTDVMGALEKMDGSVRWFGRSILAVQRIEEAR